VRLLKEEGLGLTEAARRLGVDRSYPTRWRRQLHGEQTAEPLAASAQAQEAELRRQREEV
jgi:transposase-like protein